METQEKLDIVRTAQEMILEAHEMLMSAVGDDRNTRAYVLDHLKILATSDHGFLDSSKNLDDIIEELSENLPVADISPEVIGYIMTDIFSCMMEKVPQGYTLCDYRDYDRAREFAKEICEPEVLSTVLAEIDRQMGI